MSHPYDLLLISIDTFTVGTWAFDFSRSTGDINTAHIEYNKKIKNADRKGVELEMYLCGHMVYNGTTDREHTDNWIRDYAKRVVTQ